MSSRAAVALGGFVLLVLALLAGHFNIDQLIDADLFTGIRIAVGVLGAGMLAGAALTLPAADKPPDSRLLVTTAVLVLLAIYLPELRFGDAVKWLFDSDLVDDAEQAAALTWTRVALAFGALTILASVRFRFALELSVAVVGVLIVVAAVAATADAIANLDSPPKESATREASFDRAYTIPVAKLQTVTRDLRRDSCVAVKVVEATDPDTSDAKNALVYETRSYPARLVAAVKAGAPSENVAIELSKTDDRFASDLFGAAAIYLLSTEAAQKDGAVCNP
jgi:hypothetical protein